VSYSSHRYAGLTSTPAPDSSGRCAATTYQLTSFNQRTGIHRSLPCEYCLRCLPQCSQCKLCRCLGRGLWPAHADGYASQWQRSSRASTEQASVLPGAAWAAVPSSATRAAVLLPAAQAAVPFPAVVVPEQQQWHGRQQQQRRRQRRRRRQQPLAGFRDPRCSLKMLRSSGTSAACPASHMRGPCVPGGPGGRSSAAQNHHQVTLQLVPVRGGKAMSTPSNIVA
jgi:hypothetical protein